MSQSELKKQIEDARLEVMESDKEIALIRSKIRNLPSSDDSSDLNFNSLVLIPTKITGLPESAEPKISIQCSSPIEECTVNFNLSGGSDSNITFTDVDVESATLTVSLSDKDLKLGSSAVLDIKPWTEVDKDTFDYVNGNQVIQDLAVAIVSDDETVTVPSKESDSGSSNTANLKPIILCGPSGAGKGTLINKLFEAFPDKFGFSVSHTTRKPREGEEHGIHYNFTSVEVMKQEIDDNKFIEYAQVHGNYYGTSVESVEKVSTTGKICVLDIDVQGVQKVKNSHLDATYIFIAPPSMETLESRLRGRGTEKEDDIQKRLANAIGEIEYGQSEGNFDKYLINDDLETAIEELIDTVKDFYPHLSSSMNTKELESSVDPAAAVLVPKFLIHFRILYHPSINAKKEMLYDALSKASKHKAVAVENLRKSAAALNRLMTEESEGNEEGDDDDYGRKKKNPILKSGFLNRKKSTKIEPPFFVRWYNKTLGPNSFIRRTYPIAKNYIIFFGGVVLMHFQGHQLALPPPV